MREPDEYKKWHIRDSVNYFFIMMNQDKTIPELFRFVIEFDLLNLTEKSNRQNDHNLYAR